MKEEYEKHVAERAAQGVVPKPLSPQLCSALVEQLKNPPKGEEEYLLNLLKTRVPPGVDEAAYVKASFLTSIVKGMLAIEILGTMQGGYNVETLISALEDTELAPVASKVRSENYSPFSNWPLGSQEDFAAI
eukprot:763959-Hanusia_phi.AAC.3